MNTKNRYGVPTRAWTRWAPAARHVFNETYGSMRNAPWAFLPDKMDRRIIAPAAWQRLAWNAAWNAASAAHHGLRETVELERAKKAKKAG